MSGFLLFDGGLYCGGSWIIGTTGLRPVPPPFSGGLHCSQLATNLYAEKNSMSRRSQGRFHCGM